MGKHSPPLSHPSSTHGEELRTAGLALRERILAEAHARGNQPMSAEELAAWRSKFQDLFPAADIDEFQTWLRQMRGEAPTLSSVAHSCR